MRHLPNHSSPDPLPDPAKLDDNYRLFRWQIADHKFPHRQSLSHRDQELLYQDRSDDPGPDYPDHGLDKHTLDRLQYRERKYANRKRCGLFAG